MNRDELIQKIQQRIGRRKLVWFGTRGEDARPLMEIPQFSEVFSIIAPLGSLSVRNESCLETLKKERVDLDNYSLDEDDTPEADELRRRLFASLGEPAVVVPYRPLSFFTSVYYPRYEFVEYLGLFHERQAPFEHKPWVESELSQMGINVLPWQYLADDDSMRLLEAIESGPVVLRANRSDGGAGLDLVSEAAEIGSRWPAHVDGFLAMASLLEPHIPLNVNACVFSDGQVSLHAPSIQLIALPGYTTRRFGYCGNDFAQVRELDPQILDELEDITMRAGNWLAGRGYLGAFGVDAMHYEGNVFLTEINPRFQGSSAVSARLDRELDRSDLFLDHISAFLGLAPPPPIRLRDLAAEQPRLSQIICHNCCPRTVSSIKLDSTDLQGFECSLVPAADISVRREAILFRAVVEDRLTTDGHCLDDRYDRKLKRLLTDGILQRRKASFQRPHKELTKKEV